MEGIKNVKRVFALSGEKIVFFFSLCVFLFLFFPQNQVDNDKRKIKKRKLCTLPSCEEVKKGGPSKGNIWPLYEKETSCAH